MFSVHGAAPGVSIKKPLPCVFTQAASLVLVLRRCQYTSGVTPVSHLEPVLQTQHPQLFPLSHHFELFSCHFRCRQPLKKGLSQFGGLWALGFPSHGLHCGQNLLQESCRSVIAKLAESVQRYNVGYPAVNSCYGCFGAAPAGHHSGVCVHRV